MYDTYIIENPPREQPGIVVRRRTWLSLLFAATQISIVWRGQVLWLPQGSPSRSTPAQIGGVRKLPKGRPRSDGTFALQWVKLKNRQAAAQEAPQSNSTVTGLRTAPSTGSARQRMAAWTTMFFSRQGAGACLSPRRPRPRPPTRLAAQYSLHAARSALALSNAIWLVGL